MIKGDQPVLVDFYADWCGPCQTMAPIIKEVKKEVGEKIRVLKVDVDRNPKAAQIFGVRGIPTFILFKNGKQVWRQSGAIPKRAILDAVKKI
jgi:thioredoxin 1